MKLGHVLSSILSFYGNLEYYISWSLIFLDIYAIIKIALLSCNLWEIREATNWMDKYGVKISWFPYWKTQICGSKPHQCQLWSRENQDTHWWRSRQQLYTGILVSSSRLPNFIYKIALEISFPTIGYLEL